MSRMDTVTRWLQELPLTLAFGALLGIAELDYAVLPDRTAQRWAQWASTNVDRLTSEPFGPLLTSPFIILEDHVLWLMGAVLGMGIVEFRFGWRRTLVLVLASHLLGTLVSEGLVWWRERRGELPASALHQIDVGVSYVVVGALTVALLAGKPTYIRIAPFAALAFIAPDLVDGLGDYDVAAVGHVTAFSVAGIVWVGWLVRDRRRLRNRRFLPI